jgi:hypothetical protein
MENGKWKMGNGGLTMDNGQWWCFGSILGAIPF